jgi:hypothetical protein
METEAPAVAARLGDGVSDLAVDDRDAVGAGAERLVVAPGLRLQRHGVEGDDELDVVEGDLHAVDEQVAGVAGSEVGDDRAWRRSRLPPTG